MSSSPVLEFNGLIIWSSSSLKIKEVKIGVPVKFSPAVASPSPPSTMGKPSICNKKVSAYSFVLLLLICSIHPVFNAFYGDWNLLEQGVTYWLDNSTRNELSMGDEEDVRTYFNMTLIIYNE